MGEQVQSPVEGSHSSNISDRKIPDEQGKVQQQLAEQILSAYKEAKRYRATYDKNWERWYRLYSGQHWDGPRPEWRSTPVVNFIFSTIETILPIMTDQSPEINVVPSNYQSTKMAAIMGQVMEKLWVDNDMDLKLPEIVKNSLKYGTGIAKVWWNTKMAENLGDVAVSVVDPRHFYPSPGAKSIEDAAYLIFAANVPLDNILRDFPEAKGKITGGIWDEDLTIQKTITSQRSDSGSFLGPVSNTLGTDTTSFKGNLQGKDGVMDRTKLCTIIEWWHRDDSGQTWVTIMANGVLLKHDKNPFNHNKYPFVRFIDYQVPGMFWGMGEIQQLEKLQDNINQRRAQITDILRLTANPPFVADADSGVNPKAMTNRPATIIYKNRGSEVRWLTPPQLPAALFDLQELDKKDFDAISGVLDVTQGRRPVGIEAASAISELQEAAQTRIRFKVRIMEAAMRQLGKLMLALVQQFYTEERVIRIKGPGGSANQFVTLNQQQINPDTGEAERINDVTVGEYDIEIGVGSTLPVDKTRRANQMIELFQMGLVDQRAVLENIGLPPEEYEQIIARMQEIQQQQMMMAQGAQPGGGEPQGGAPPGDSGQGPAGGPQGQPPTEQELQELENS
jgi:hypothetical protein